MNSLNLFIQKALIVTLVLFLGGCSYKPDMHNAKIALDYEGTYVGTFPCQSCEGIRTTLHIMPQQRYEKKIVHLGESINVYESKGFFNWHPSGNIIWLDDSSSYFVSENHLLLLDRHDKIIDREIYRLDKFGISYILPKDQEEQ